MTQGELWRGPSSPFRLTAAARTSVRRTRRSRLKERRGSRAVVGNTEISLMFSAAPCEAAHRIGRCVAGTTRELRKEVKKVSRISKEERATALDVLQDSCVDAAQAKSLARSRINENVPSRAVHELLLADTLANAREDLGQLLELAANEELIQVAPRKRLDVLLALTKTVLDFFVRDATVGTTDSAAVSAE